ncbi:MAG TPA: hypothetical protein VHB69_08315, partial [Mycobacteriales bacterium]|nr:hypothetical protein [Mycobacteriales bacterium]
TSLVVAMASLMVIDPASEIGDVRLFTGAGNPDGSLLELRWSSGLRGLAALVAFGIAIVAARLLVGRRARVRVGVSAPEADDPASLDAIEAAAVAALPVPAAAPSTIVGAALLVSLISFVFNACAFGYAMASNVPHSSNQIGF